MPNALLVSNRAKPKCERLSPVEMLVLIQLLNMGRQNSPFPSLDTLAELCGVTRNTIGTAIKSLNRSGMLAWETGVPHDYRGRGKTDARRPPHCSNTYDLQGTIAAIKRTAEAVAKPGRRKPALSGDKMPHSLASGDLPPGHEAAPNGGGTYQPNVPVAKNYDPSEFTPDF